jgi:hypothetical protein
MPTAFVAAGVCTLLGTLLLAAPHQIFSGLSNSRADLKSTEI